MFNLSKKSKVSYIVDNDVYKLQKDIPSSFFEDVIKYSNSQDFGCPANKSMKNRVFYIPAFADVSIEFGVKDDEPYYLYQYNENQMPINPDLQYLLEKIFFLGVAKNNVLNLQITLPYLFVTDDEDLELMSVVPNVEAKNAEYALGSFYPYAWLRHINSAWISSDTDKPSYLEYKKGEPMVMLVFNKPVEITEINMSQKIYNYKKTHHHSTVYTFNTINWFKRVIKKRPKKLL